MAQEIVDPVGYPRVGHILSVEDANCNVSVTLNRAPDASKRLHFSLCARPLGVLLVTPIAY